MSAAAEGDVLVLYGISGDLAHKMVLPALFHLSRAGRLDVPVVGVAKTDWDDLALRAAARQAVQAASGDQQPSEEDLSAFTAKLSIVAGDYADPDLFTRLASALDGRSHPVHYLAIPPSLFGSVVASLDDAHLLKGARVVIEKPFGHDLASAEELNTSLGQHLDEDQIYRVDHFLGKEAVEDLMVFRFANALFLPVWDRAHVASIQLTMAESFDIKGRGSFYDANGAIRDVLQNHLLQVLSFLTAERPTADRSDSFSDMKAALLEAVQPLSADDVVLGQYDGYLDEPGVRAGSTTETYAAVRLQIDNDRWRGVPVLIRTGKSLPCTALEAVIELKQTDVLHFVGADTPPDPNVIRLRLGHDDGVTITIQAKEPGERDQTRSVDLDVDFSRSLGVRDDAYARLLHDALIGERKRFARLDVVEAAWRIVDPVLDVLTPAPYAKGTWGPDAAAALAPGGWHTPAGCPAPGV